MKVAFVTQPLDGRIPPPNNSIGIVVYEFARKLAEFMDVSVFTFGSKLRAGTVCDQGVQYHHMPVFLDRYAEKVMRTLRKDGDPRVPYYASSFSYPFYAWQIARNVRKRKIDILHINNYSQFIPFTRALNPDVKIVLHMHCEWLSQLNKTLIEPRLDKTNLILGCSEFVINRVKERFPHLSDRCRSLHNGIDVTRFIDGGPIGKLSEKAGEGPIITFVGRVSPEKGVHVLLDAMARVVKQLPEASLEVIGPFGNVPAEYVLSVTDDPITKELARFYGPGGISTYETDLRDKVRIHHLQEHVRFVGRIPNAQLHERLRSADILVFPSVWEEPFGIPPVEAMAMGKPVIATRSGGMNETVLDQETGILVERNDAAALASAVLQLLRDPRRKREIGRAAHERAHTAFSYRVLSAQLLDLYDGLFA